MRRAIAIVSFLLISLLPLPLAAQTVETGKIVEGMTCASDPTQTYSLYLPSRLTPDRKWPLLYVFDPRGRGTLAAERFRAAAETYGWIVISSNDTRSDGPPDPNVRAINALLPEASRYPVDPKRVYLTGFSGGAILAFLIGAANGDGIAGVIGCGGRFPDGWKRHPVKFAHWGSAGSTDFNNNEMRQIDGFLEKTGSMHRFEQFEGSHEWMPVALAEDAVAWMELDAMRRGLRERDDAMIERRWAAELAAAESLVSDRDSAALLRRWKSIERTFRGLRDVPVATARIMALEAAPAVRTALRDEKRWDEYETGMIRQMGVAVATLRHEEAPVAKGRLAAELRIDELRRHESATSPYESLASKRVLASMYSQMSFYLFREFVVAGRFDRAALVLEVAETLRPGTSAVRYNLACMLAKSGEKSRALDALEAAVGAGFGDAALMRTDDDLASLRDEPRFKAALARIAGAP
ncbi:MAG: hypothetical protein WC538_02860 [Thermoanaerobaculia bacterium]|jgi:predicted esterase